MANGNQGETELGRAKTDKQDVISITRLRNAMREKDSRDSTSYSIKKVKIDLKIQDMLKLSIRSQHGLIL